MGQQFHPTLAGGRGPRGLWLRRPGLRSRQESPADVVGDIAVQRLVVPIESELPRGRGEHEVDLQPLLHARAPVLEVDRAGVLEHFLPLLRGLRISGDVPAAVEVRQLAVADDLQRLEGHHAVAAAECLRGAAHEGGFGSGPLGGQPACER